jgi:hypothetical protein
MAESQKRFPYRLLACSVLLVLLAAVLSFIETVGRRGTLVGRYQQIKDDMSAAQVAHALGVRPQVRSAPFTNMFLTADMEYVDGPVKVVVRFELIQADHPCDPSELSITDRHLYFGQAEGTRLAWAWWHMRRWAEQAWMAIHGSRH